MLSISPFQLLGLESLEAAHQSESEWRCVAVFPLLLLKEEMNTLRSPRLISTPVLETILFLLFPKAPKRLLSLNLNWDLICDLHRQSDWHAVSQSYKHLFFLKKRLFSFGCAGSSLPRVAFL